MSLSNHVLLTTSLVLAVPFVHECDLDIPVEQETVDEPGVCGDGLLAIGERCDDGNLAAGDGCDGLCGLEAVEFPYTGAVQSYIVPPGVTRLRLEVWGAAGGTTTSAVCDPPDIGGLGGRAVGELAVEPGQTLAVRVGGAGGAGDAPGYNGGGGSCPTLAVCSSGGGATDIRAGDDSLEARIIVGGGGGGAEFSCGGHGGGHGGGLEGTPGLGGDEVLADGGGGTQASGGAGGDSDSSVGSPGGFGFGGKGPEVVGNTHGGGGGGGWYGGGGGGDDGHGGGGSSYLGTLAEAATEPGARAGDGLAVITPL
ncbi:glycine-rich protein [Nannocystis bainbridge]|uniref:receptor protein-tyrosine kinase n=1 Tax=Nannocystis bainbridge TaxID=2995303 RepID=A0ABT5E534_9BACT|nr:glycine-rich protein [Nannocystis bainbridge]MDC0720970.1 glycine-rich protein [Nannocystis bainbridge]